MIRRNAHAVLIPLLGLTLCACVSMKKIPDDGAGADPSPAEAPVNSCTFTAHLKCIYLTGAETVSDGMDLQWTRHWFRMSYIGRACEREHGRTTGVAVEALFAVPHYLWIGIGNTLGAFLSPLRLFQSTEEPPPDTIADQ